MATVRSRRVSRAYRLHPCLPDRGRRGSHKDRVSCRATDSWKPYDSGTPGERAEANEQDSYDRFLPRQRMEIVESNRLAASAVQQ
jgi:hypothetical protein